MSLEDSDPTNPPRPIPELTKSDNGQVDIGRDDLVVREKKRLGDYVAYLTKIVYKNEYPLTPGSEDIKLRTQSGNPAPVVDSSHGAEKIYSDTLSDSEGGQRARSIFENISNSGLLDTDSPFQIKKGKSDDNKKTGAEYFRDIDTNLGNAEIPQRLDKVLLENNRFNEKNPAFSSGQREGQDNSLGSLIVQPVLGQHAPGKFPNKAFGDGKDFTSISIDKLKQFGIMTMLHASGEANVPVPGEENDFLGTIGRNVSTAPPGIARLGVRIETTRFDGVKILNEIEPTFKKEIRDKNPASGRPVLSYGNVNSVLVPFDGLASASSMTGAAILSLTVSGMLKSLYLILNGISAEQSGVPNPPAGQPASLESKKLRLGSYKTKDSLERHYIAFNEASGLNLISTKFPYFECVNKGIDVFFFGQVNSQQQIGAINQAMHVQRLHGYYNVIFRNLVRGTSDLLVGLVNQHEERGRSAYDVDPNLSGTDNSITDLIETTLGIVKIINNSRLLKFMNIMAIIGEVAIISEQVGIYSSQDLIADEGEDDTGAVVPKLGIIHAKNRLSDTFGGKIAWGKSTVKSMYLLPTEVMTAATRLDGGNTTRFSGLTRDKGFRQPSSGNRFSSEQVAAFENYLEADYMPFYFHDLRTNEIIAFHAFLESISDSYSVDYTESEGYGRVGKVYTYKNTNRSIEMEFAIVATSLDDFDEMWWSINKLITLLYPQYTEGRNLVIGNDSFIQPFSQLPAASPLIRLRLGDILKSNYNKFNLARIFGVGQNSFYIQNAEQRQQAQEQQRQRLERQEEIRTSVRQRMTKFEWQQGDKAIMPANWQATWARGHSPISAYRRIVVEGNAPTRQGRDTSPDLHLTAPRKVRIVNNNTQRAEAIGVTHEVTVELITPIGEAENGLFTVSPYLLEIDNDYVEEIVVQQTASDPQSQPSDTIHQDSEAVRNFFASEGDDANPIFKSFESVRGKGLAGFIKTFNMGVDNNFPWETVGLNNRAPKMVRVSIQFLPIHDLQPGLDSNGFNSAPVYNVGGMLRKINSDDGGNSMTTENEQYKASTNIVINRNGSPPGGSNT